MNESFDLHALIRAAVVSIAAGFIVGAAGFFILQKRNQWEKWKGAILFGLAGFAMLFAIGLYYGWPSLLAVPKLDGLSQAEAEESLVGRGLVPNGRPQYSFDVPEGRVIPHSQSPGYGLKVRPGTVVTFAVCTRQEKPDIAPHTGNGAVTLFRPKAGEHLLCHRGADGIFRFEATGTSAGVSDSGPSLLLWVRPVNPPSESNGWYLQRPPSNGVMSVASDGSWIASGQVGNAQWPPHEGDSIDVAVSIADHRAVNELIAEPGVVIRNAPVGSKSAVASDVVITLK
jgi:hypothetical protein